MGINIFDDTPDSPSVGDPFSQPAPSFGVSLFSDEPPKKLLPVSQIPGALPALGSVDIKPSFTSTEDLMYKLFQQSPAGLVMQGAEAAGVVPKYYTEQKMSSARDALVGWLPGLAEEAQKLTGIDVPGVDAGDRQAELARQAENLQAVAAQPPTTLQKAVPGLKTATDFFGELGAQLVPGMIPGASLGAEGAKLLPAAARPLGTAAGVIAEGALQGVGNTAGMPWNKQRLEEVGKMVAIAGLGGALGYMGALRENAAMAAEKVTGSGQDVTLPPDPLADPALAARAAAYNDASKQISDLRSQVVDEKLQGDAQKAASIALNDLSTLRDQVQQKADAAAVVQNDAALRRVLLEQAKGATQELSGPQRGLVAAVNNDYGDYEAYASRLNYGDTQSVLPGDLTQNGFRSSGDRTIVADRHSIEGTKTAWASPSFLNETRTMNADRTLIAPQSALDQTKNAADRTLSVGGSVFDKTLLANRQSLEDTRTMNADRTFIAPKSALDETKSVADRTSSIPSSMLDRTIRANQSALDETRTIGFDQSLLDPTQRVDVENTISAFDLLPEAAAHKASITGDYTTLNELRVLNPMDATQAVDQADMTLRKGMTQEIAGNLAADSHTFSTKVAETMMMNALQSEDTLHNPYIGMSNEDLVKAEGQLKSREQKAIADLQYANKIMDSLPKRPDVNLDQAVQSIHELRATAFKAAQSLGVPDLFNNLDVQYRMEKVLKGPAFVEPETTFRTPERAMSEYLDLQQKVLEKVSNAAKNKYQREFARGNRLAPSIEDFVAQKTNEAATKYNKRVQDVLTVNSGKDPAEVIRALDKFSAQVMRTEHLKAADVEFRGYTKAAQQSMAQESAAWLSPHVAEGGFPHMSTEDIVALAQRAKQDRAPLGVFDILNRQIEQRKAGLPPVENPSERAVLSGDGGNPEVFDSALKKQVAETRQRVIQHIVGGPDVRDPNVSDFVKVARKTAQFFREQSQPLGQGQLTEGRAGGMIGHYVSMEDAISDQQSPAVRKTMRNFWYDLRTQSANVQSKMTYEMATGIHDVGVVATAYAKRYNAATGSKISPHDVVKSMYEYYTKGMSGDFPDPVVRETLQNNVAKRIDNLTNILIKNVSDKALRDKLIENLGRYLFQDYSVLRDPEAVFKKVNRNDSAYQRFFNKMKARDLEGMDQEGYALFRKQVLEGNPNLSEAEVATAIENAINESVHSQIKAMMVKNLTLPDQRANIRSILPTPMEKYFKPRIINDADFKRLLGGTDNIATAMHSTVQQIAHDIAADNVRRGLYNMFKDTKMITESPIGPNVVAIDKTSLRTIHDGEDVAGGVLYAHPAVASIMEGLTAARNVTDPIGKSLGAIKAGMIASTHFFMMNLIGFPQMASVSAGLGAFLSNPLKNLMSSVQGAVELSFPGSAGLKSGQGISKFFGEDLLKSAGLMDQESLRAIASDMHGIGLDKAGALVEDIVQSAQSAFHGSKPEKAGTWSHKMYNAMRIWDLAAKLFGHAGQVRELQWKEGTPTLSTEQMKQVVQRTLNTVQTPDTTPAFISNMSKGPLALVEGGFKSYPYQMARSIVYSGMYGLYDIFHGLRLLKSDSAKGVRYISAGSFRVANTALAAYFGANAIINHFNENPDKEEALRHFLPEGVRDSRVIVGKIDRKDGATTVSYLNTGRINLYDNVMQITESIAKNLRDKTYDNIPGDVLTKLAVQIFAPGILAPAVLTAGGARVSQNWVDTKWQDPQKPGSLRFTGKNARRAAETLMPAVARPVISAVEGYYARKAMSEAAKLKNPMARKEAEQKIDEMYNLDLHRGYAKAVSQLTGYDKQVADLNQMVNSRFKEDWNKTAAGWINSAVKDYKNLKMDSNARAAYFQKYEPMWKNTWTALQDSVNYAKGLQYTDNELRKIITPEKGPNPPFSKKIMDDLLARRKLSFRDYLQLTNAQAEQNYWK